MVYVSLLTYDITVMFYNYSGRYGGTR